MSPLSATNTIQPILVAACGNIWAGDDAFGPLVAQALRARTRPGIDVIDLGMKPIGLLDHLQNRAAIIIVDAAEPTPGFRECDLIDVDFMSPQRPALLHDATLSSHGLSIAHELALAQQLDMLPPRVHLIAAIATFTAMGETASPRVVQMIPLAVERILALSATCSFVTPQLNTTQAQDVRLPN